MASEKCATCGQYWTYLLCILCFNWNGVWTHCVRVHFMFSKLPLRSYECLKRRRPTDAWCYVRTPGTSLFSVTRVLWILGQSSLHKKWITYRPIGILANFWKVKRGHSNWGARNDSGGGRVQVHAPHGGPSGRFPPQRRCSSGFLEWPGSVGNKVNVIIYKNVKPRPGARLLTQYLCMCDFVKIIFHKAFDESVGAGAINRT